MKDKSQDPYIHGLRPCPFSTHCFRLVDELDTLSTSHQVGQASSADDRQDLSLLEQLRVHVPTCPTCTSTLALARRMRDQQRQALHALLLEGEQVVPATTPQIFQALAREHMAHQKRSTGMNNHHQQLEEMEIMLPFEPPQQVTTTSRRLRATLRSGFYLVAAAAVVLAFVGVFSRIAGLHTTPETTTAPHFTTSRTPIVATKNWTGIVTTSVTAGLLTIAIYDPDSENSIAIASVDAANSAFDGVSHDGKQLLYHVYNGTQTIYHLWSLSGSNTAKNSSLYAFSGKSGVAIWSTNDQDIFVSTPLGVEQVEIARGTATMILPTVSSPALRFYRTGYLYFLKSDGIITRINISTGAMQAVTTCASESSFWLSPSGATVYYTCTNQQDLYAVNSDGSNPRLLRTNTHAAAIVGYAERGEVLTLAQHDNTYQIIKLGTDASHDLPILTDVAPGAQQVTASDVAVAPLGYSFIAKGTYTSGQQKIWYGDLIAGTSHVVSVPSSNASLTLIGWAELSVPAETIQQTPQPTLSQSFSNRSSAWDQRSSSASYITKSV